MLSCEVLIWIGGVLQNSNILQVQYLIIARISLVSHTLHHKLRGHLI